jgi:signal transduction histidine kinase
MTIEIDANKLGYDNLGSSQREEYMTLFSASAGKMRRFFSSVVSDQTTGGLSPCFDVVAAASEVIHECPIRYPDVKIQFSVCSSSKPQLLHGERELFTRMLENLVSNAVNAMNCKGSIRIHIDRMDGLISIIFTHDTCGITKSFIRGLRSKTTVPVTPGTIHGVGLSTVRLAVDRLGGSLLITLGTNDSITFRVLLPSAEKKQERERPKSIGFRFLR